MVKQPKTLSLHFLLWSLWFGLNSLSLVRDSRQLTTDQWLQLAWNYLSLVMVFYAITSISRSFFNNLSFHRIQSYRWPGKAWYILTRREVFYIAGITTLYVGISIFLDNVAFGYNYPDLFSHIDRRLSRVMPYIPLAVLYTLYQFQMAKMKGRLQKNNTRIYHLKDHISKLEQIQRTQEALQQQKEKPAN